jgi:hypothetical protein
VDVGFQELVFEDAMELLLQQVKQGMRQVIQQVNAAGNSNRWVREIAAGKRSSLCMLFAAGKRSRICMQFCSRQSQQATAAGG